MADNMRTKDIGHLHFKNGRGYAREKRSILPLAGLVYSTQSTGEDDDEVDFGSVRLSCGVGERRQAEPEAGVQGVLS